MIGCSKENRGNYPGKCFGTKEEETGLRFNPGLALIGLPTTGQWGIKANNWAPKKLTSEASPAGRGNGWWSLRRPCYPLTPSSINPLFRSPRSRRCQPFFSIRDPCPRLSVTAQWRDHLNREASSYITASMTYEGFKALLVAPGRPGSSKWN